MTLPRPIDRAASPVPPRSRRLTTRPAVQRPASGPDDEVPTRELLARLGWLGAGLALAHAIAAVVCGPAFVLHALAAAIGGWAL